MKIWIVPLLGVALLAVALAPDAAACAPCPIEERGNLSRPGTHIEATLETTLLSRDFEDASFEEVVLSLGESIEMGIVLDGRLYRHLDPADLRVTFKINEISLKDALDLLTGMHGLSWKYSCGAIVVSTGRLLERYPNEPPGLHSGSPDSAVALHQRLANNFVPGIQMEKKEMFDVLEYLQERFPVDIVMNPMAWGQLAPGTTVSLRLGRVTFWEALVHVCNQTGTWYQIREGIVCLIPSKRPGVTDRECFSCGERKQEGARYCSACGMSLRD